MFHFYITSLLQIFVVRRQISAAISYRVTLTFLPAGQFACVVVSFVCCLQVCLSVSQLAEARDKTLQRVNRAADYKELKGKGPSSAELVKKIEQVY